MVGMCGYLPFRRGVEECVEDEDGEGEGDDVFEWDGGGLRRRGWREL